MVRLSIILAFSPSHIPKGIEGTYITYHQDFSPEDDDPLQGVPFVVSPSLGTSPLIR